MRIGNVSYKADRIAVKRSRIRTLIGKSTDHVIVYLNPHEHAGFQNGKYCSIKTHTRGQKCNLDIVTDYT